MEGGRGAPVAGEPAGLCTLLFSIMALYCPSEPPCQRLGAEWQGGVWTLGVGPPGREDDAAGDEGPSLRDDFCSDAFLPRAILIGSLHQLLPYFRRARSRLHEDCRLDARAALEVDDRTRSPGRLVDGTPCRRQHVRRPTRQQRGDQPLRGANLSSSGGPVCLSIFPSIHSSTPYSLPRSTLLAFLVSIIPSIHPPINAIRGYRTSTSRKKLPFPHALGGGAVWWNDDPYDPRHH